MKRIVVAPLIGCGLLLCASDGTQRWNPAMDWEYVKRRAIAQIMRRNETMRDNIVADWHFRGAFAIGGDAIEFQRQPYWYINADVCRQRQHLLAAEIVGPHANPVAVVNARYPEEECVDAVNTSGLRAESLLGLFSFEAFCEHDDVKKIKERAEHKLHLYHNLLDKRKHLFADERVQQFLHTRDLGGVDTSRWDSLEALDKKLWDKINYVYNTPIHPAIEIDIDTRLTPLSDTSGE